MKELLDYIYPHIKPQL